MSETPARFADYKSMSRWLKEHGGDIFPNATSAEWFIRNHRHELIRSGELIARRGSAGNLVGPGFERVVLDILMAESLRTIAPEMAA